MWCTIGGTSSILCGMHLCLVELKMARSTLAWSEFVFLCFFFPVASLVYLQVFSFQQLKSVCLIQVNMIGINFEDNHVATGLGNHLARPILRDEWHENLTFEEGVKLLEKCMRVLLYRDRSAVNKIQVLYCFLFFLCPVLLFPSLLHFPFIKHVFKI